MISAAKNRIRELPILLLLPHNRCNCHCLMCDIWKIREVREITENDLTPHLSSLRELKVKWIVFSGGEPLMHSHLPVLCRSLRREGMRLTLLTSGLLIERHAATICELFDDVIVSLDGPREVHDAIRRVRGAYDQLQRGVCLLRMLRPDLTVHGRCTVQKENCAHLRNTVWTAHSLMLDSISFLAADVTSSAFNRPGGWPEERVSEVALDADDVNVLDEEIQALITDCRREFKSGFIVEKPEKLRRIALHFQSQLGEVQPESPRCNAPWVSAVIEADGTVRPCFFHRPIGNIHDRSLSDIVNGDIALKFREQLDIATNPTCRNCVCSLYLEEADSSERSERRA